MIEWNDSVTYTVLLCVDYDENVLRRYNDLLRLCEIQGGGSYDNLYVTRRNLRITQDRIVQYNLILALGGDDARDVAKRIYNEGGQIAVAFFDLFYSTSAMIPYIQAVKDWFPALICAVALYSDGEKLSSLSEMFSSPSQWLYFLSQYSPEQMEQLIAHLISSFILHREKEIALAKNEATRESLRNILDASPEILKKQTEKELAHLILRKLRLLTGATNTYILFFDKKIKKLRYMAGTVEFNTENALYREFQKNKDMMEQIARDKHILRTGEGIYAPLWVQNRLVGLLYLDRENMLTRGTEVLEVFAHHIAFAIENLTTQTELEQKQAWEHELQLASRIQDTLLPKSFPFIPELDIYGIMVSAKEIGGDYFDILTVEDRHYMCIGDVSGKGIPAGLIMSELRSFVRCFAMSYESPKDILLQSASLLLKDISGSGKFVSMLLFSWNHEKLTYASAGHEHILHYKHSTGKCEAFRSGGIVLGVDFRNFSRLLNEKELKWERGDTIVLFTDGATEAHNKDSQMYTLARLKNAVEKYSHLTAQNMVKAILDDIQAFIGNAEQHDDITLLAIHYREQDAVETQTIESPHKELNKPLNNPFTLFQEK
ncbi:MAG TPA: SpoIIE family protein phosphatase [Planctomycetota bacterium]|nr:SpoIIE family protein phosphatase [Planctomycetota bacterium]HQB00396.1 SpoIIE family protein phosphatase [Planctomycetota bacterium]